MSAPEPPQRPTALTIPAPRLRVWAIGLAAMGLVPVLGAVAFGFHDWPAFWSAGATAGTTDLVDASRHLAWQRAHGLPEAFFPYPAGSAWLFFPFAAIPLGVGFAVHGLLMLLVVVVAGWLAASTLGLERPVAVLALLAFAPVTASVVLGQNGTLGLALALVATVGLVQGRAVATGIAIGLLLYKPTYALPLVGLLVLRRRWTELAIVAALAAGWYVAGVAAAGGDPAWPAVWLNGLGGYLDADFAGNADKAVSLPGLVGRLGLPAFVPLLVSAAIVVAAIPRLATAPILEAAVAASLVGVAASPHAWGYDAALVAPFLLWLLAGHGRLGEPVRTPFLVAVWAGSLLWLVSRQTVLSSVALIVIALLAVWFWGQRRPETTVSASVGPGQETRP